VRGITSNRRDILKAFGAVAAVSAMAPRPVLSATRKITLTLPWVAEGGNLFAYVAKANGYWAERGLDVDIARGYGSLAASQAVGNRQFDFGLAASSAGIQQTAKGLPVMQLMSCGYDSTMGICFLEDSGISSLSGLEGKKLGATATSGEFPFLPAFAANAGFDMSKVEVVQVDAAVRQRILMEKQVSAISGFAVSFLPVFVANNIKTRFMLYSQHGLNFYNNALMTQPRRVAEEPEVCQAMADGLAEAIRFCLLNPDQALNIFFKQVPEAALTPGGKIQAKVGLGIFRVSMLSEVLRSNPIGYAVPADYESMTDLVMKHLAAPGDSRPAVDAVMTNQFAGPVRLTAEEFETAQAGAREFTGFFQ
jgi:ABC-type nitrate/sulfonate/bicarbonate transport system substrate-binding protein